MAVDYDIVIIGGTPVGFYAAAIAATWKARVALVAPGVTTTTASYSSIYSNNHSKTITKISQIAQQLRTAHQFGIYCTHPEETPALDDISVRFNQVWNWANSVAKNLESYQSSTVLSALGVDFIAGEGQFYRKPHLGFEVGDRRLRARSYLLATGSIPAVANIEGLEATGYYTNDTVGVFLKQKNLPQSIIIIGGDPSGIELAQTFNRLGKKVTLVVKSQHILPQEDPEAALLIQSQLEAEGVRVITQTEVSQAKKIEDKKWIQAGKFALEADEIFLAVGRQANSKGLNLESLGIDDKIANNKSFGLQVNEKLQTSNPRIYACGEIIGNYVRASAGQYQAGIALKNALFLPIYKVNYAGVAWGMMTDPALARVGMTQAQARKIWGEDVMVLRQYFKTISAAVMNAETTGFCKIITRKNGEILGASIVGPAAGELVFAVGLAMRHKIKVEKLAEMVGIGPSFSEILVNTAAEWVRLRLAGNGRWLDFLEGWFNWRREQSK